MYCTSCVLYKLCPVYCVLCKLCYTVSCVPVRPVGKLKINNLCELGELDIIKDYEGTVHTAHSFVGDTGLGNIIPGT